ncbi:hypothetical protein [Nocardia miyunensis]|uniref:hypothetical protein n=1 Tax=Nocardia miyunensis TaxID=282684 RepID=UPI00082B4DCB|nr:hypothetical protein [Nocardia miyunensis]
MDKLEVEMPNLAGFRLDLGDVMTNFSSNARRLLPGVALPRGTSELMATLAPAFEKFNSAVSAAHHSDLAVVDSLGSHLDTAKREYRGAEDNSTVALAAAVHMRAPDQSVDTAGITRFSGLHLPDLPEVQETQASLRNVVSAGIDFITPFDEPLSQRIGIKPAADYLAPLVADWESLQTVGERIGLLGINDYATSENIVGGTNWLQTGWTRLGSQAFGDRASVLGDTIATRSWDMDAISKIVQNAGACIERLVYNQTVGLSNDLTKPMTFVGLTLPVGVWALLTDHSMQSAYKSQILSAVDSLKTAAESRKDDLAGFIERISSALDYSPERTSPKFDTASFDIPEKLVASPGAIRYGFGDNVWWQNGTSL